MIKLRAVVFFVPCLVLGALFYLLMLAALGSEETESFFRGIGRK